MRTNSLESRRRWAYGECRSSLIHPICADSFIGLSRPVDSEVPRCHSGDRGAQRKRPSPWVWGALSHSMRTSWRRGLLVQLSLLCHWSSTKQQRWICSDVILFRKAWSSDGFMAASRTSIYARPFDDRCDLLTNVVSQSKKNASPYICLMNLCICMVHNLGKTAWRINSSKNS